jgi:hypothetical protein
MSAAEDFDELLDLYMPWDDGVAVLLKAFFDAGERNKGTFCVAGLAFGKDSLKKAEREWRKVYGKRIGHMTDLHARRNEFEGITDSESQLSCADRFES